MIKSDRKHNKIILILAAFTIASVLCSLAACACGVSIRQCFLFAFYQTGIIFVPGIAIYFCLYSNKKDETDSLGFCCISYAIGYGLQIVAYFLIAFTGFHFFSAQIVCGLLLIISVPVILMKAHQSSLTIKRSGTVWYVLFLLFLLLTFFAYSARYLLPGVKNDIAVYHADALYWIENAAALTKSFPPAELRMSGTILYYHYFASAYLAFANMVTGIDVFSLGYALYPFGKCLIFFGGLYTLSKVFSYDRRKQFFFLFVLLFTTGLEKYSIVNYVAHILTLPFGFDLSFGFGAYFLAYLIRQNGSLNTDKQSCILAVFSFLMCTGHKAPVALVYLAFAGVLCLCWLLGKQFRKAFTNGLPLLFCFLFVMVVCIGFLTNKDNGVGVGGFSHVATLRASPLFNSYEPVALNREPGISGIFSILFIYLKLMVLLILSINPLLIFLIVHGIADCIYNNTFKQIDWALLAAIVFGFFMGLFNAQEGVSQMYYTLAVTIPAAVFGIIHLNLNGKRYQKVVCYISVILASVQCIWFFNNSGVAMTVFNGVHTLTDTNYKIAEEIIPYSIQKSDYEALCWVRDNTNAHSVVLTDRSVLCNLDNYMYYGTFSERQMYLEGDRYFYQTFLEQREKRKEVICELYQNSIDALEFAIQDGVDYILQTKWLTPSFEGLGCTPVYESNTITVWQIEK
jgi:hypothetical protein